jgi:aminoglycoside phosphotransferase (APT) family kinase protein
VIDAALKAALGDGVRIEGLRKLSGGASRESWSFDAAADGTTPRKLVVQIERRAPADARIGIDVQARLLRAARAAGVPVPEVVAEATHDDASIIVLEHVDGETIARRLLRDDAYANARDVLASQCGEALARIHTLPTDEALDGSDQPAMYRGLLDALGEPHPAFELAFRWLDAHRPPPSGRTVVHGDFRLGNLIVGADGLRAVIDWELAHAGDPMEDLGWICVKSWRFGAEKPVGGFGTRDDLFAAYERVSGLRVDPGVVAWWEVFGTLRWGIICILQASRHLSGAERSVELAAIGRRVCEVEHDLMGLLP